EGDGSAVVGDGRVAGGGGVDEERKQAREAKLYGAAVVGHLGVAQGRLLGQEYVSEVVGDGRVGGGALVAKRQLAGGGGVDDDRFRRRRAGIEGGGAVLIVGDVGMAGVGGVGAAERSEVGVAAVFLARIEHRSGIVVDDRVGGR